MVGQAPAEVRALVEALHARADVQALTLFGSQARAGETTAADGGSDVDLHVICADPKVLHRPEWAEAVLGAGRIEVWCPRPALGGVIKISILLAETELDLVVVPVRRMRWARWGVAWGLHRRLAWAQQQLGPLVLVMGPGHRVLKGGARWEGFWHRVVHEVPEPRLSAAEIRRLALEARVNERSLRRKLARGELLAAQRWLHAEMATTNFRLMHELRRRRGQVSFFDARRLEQLLNPAERERLTVDARLTAEALTAAATRASATTAWLAQQLEAELAQGDGAER